MADGTKLPTAGGTMTGQLISTRANNAGDGQGQIFLNGTSGNRIDFANVGLGLPSFTTRSAGTKLVLYPQLTAASTDYGTGVDISTLWTSVPLSPAQFRWCAHVGCSDSERNRDLDGGKLFGCPFWQHNHRQDLADLQDHQRRGL